MFCSPNSRSCIADGISRICGSPLTDDLGKYVGMPLIHSRVNKHTYAGLLDKIQCRLSSWKSKTSNMTGRLTLIHSVTVSVPIYSMQSCKLLSFSYSFAMILTNLIEISFEVMWRIIGGCAW